MTRRALITGIAGQDGSYLAERLLRRGYSVFGAVRPELADAPQALPDYLKPLRDKIMFLPVRLERPTDLQAAFRQALPDECYHLGGPSVVDIDQMGERIVFGTTVDSTRVLLDAIKASRPDCRFFLAGSSEMFGRAATTPQDEDTAFNPRSTYGFAKLSAYHMVRRYREKHDLFACTGILYNHESPRRSPLFLPRKVSLAAARIKLGIQDRLLLGNLDSVRDWGYAPEYVEAMWQMLHMTQPQDLVVATGRLQSVRDLVSLAFDAVGLDYREFVELDQRFMRRAEAVSLCGNPARILDATGWQAHQPLSAIVTEMVEADLANQRVLASARENA